jgi:hypothetical protein
LPGARDALSSHGRRHHFQLRNPGLVADGAENLMAIRELRSLSPFLVFQRRSAEERLPSEGSVEGVYCECKQDGQSSEPYSRIAGR